jgi:hypothetical protein
MIIYAAILGFIALASLVVGLTVLDARRASLRLSEAMARYGYTVVASKAEKSQLAKALQFVNGRHARRRLVMNLYRKELSGEKLSSFVCDLHFASGGGEGTGGKWQVAGVTNSLLSLPQIQIDSLEVAGHQRLTKIAKFLAQNFEIPGTKIIKSGDFEFDFRFQISIAENHTEFQLPAKTIALIKQSKQGFTF